MLHADLYLQKVGAHGEHVVGRLSYQAIEGDAVQNQRCAWSFVSSLPIPLVAGKGGGRKKPLDRSSGMSATSGMANDFTIPKWTSIAVDQIRSCEREM